MNGINKKSDRTIMSFQSLRALAFMAIFLSHTKLVSLHFGAWGVSVFLVLSGFLMVYSYYEKEVDLSTKSCVVFSVNKIKKLYLLHIIMMIAALVLLIISIIVNKSFKDVLLTVAKLMFNALLLQAWIPISNIYFSLNGVSWYLSVCVLLYMAFPIIITKIKKQGGGIANAFLIYIIMLVAAFCTRGITLFDNFSKWFTYICPLFRLGDFVIGCYLGYVYINRNEAKVRRRGPYTVFEIVVFVIIGLSIYVAHNGITFMGDEWFRNSLIYIYLHQ